MSDEIMLVFGEDGVAKKYDDTWDITIHCESEEEQKAVLEKIKNSNQELPTQTNTPNALDCVERYVAIDAVKNMRKVCDTNDINEIHKEDE